MVIVSTPELHRTHGYVSGYCGVVEPQMPKSLHIFILVQLLGFMHPGDILDVVLHVACD